jgi:hypothetical protein
MNAGDVWRGETPPAPAVGTGRRPARLEAHEARRRGVLPFEASVGTST